MYINKVNLFNIDYIIIVLLCVLLINVDDFLVKHTISYGMFSITFLGIYILINRAGQQIMKTLISRVYKTIQLLPLSILDKTSSGRLITRFTNDIDDDKLIEALKPSYSYEFVNNMSSGIYEPVMERGSTLSTIRNANSMLNRGAMDLDSP